MSQIITPQGTPYTPPPPPEDDEFPLGWRYVTRTLPDGTETVDEVPLTLEDRLFPEEGDRALDTKCHRRDRDYCSLALETRYEGDQTVAVLSDHRIDFDVPGIRPMGPDVVVVFDVVEPEEETAGTYLIAQNGGHAVLAIELGSPKTRTNDQELKPPLYFRAGLEKYVIVDRGPRGDRPAQLNCYRRGRRDWVQMTPDANGRYDLSPVSVRIGLENDRVWLYDAKTGERILDHSETVLGKLAAETKAKEEAEARAKAEAKAKAKKEAKARARAEARAKEEAERSAALEERLRELEAQLRRQQGTE